MKKITPYCSALLIGLLGLQGAYAQTDSKQLELTKQILTFGDWYGAGAELGINTDNIPTRIENRFYDKSGKLVKVTEGAFMLCDSETTRIEVEKFGDLRLDTYKSYLYDENDRLNYITERKYKALNGWYYSWAATDTIQTYNYNAEGKMASKADRNNRYEYTWNGEQLTVEKKFNKYTGKLSTTTYYSNFVDANSNLPQKAVQVSKYSKFFVENEYNAEGLLMKMTQYELTDPVTDEQGNIIDGSKGNANKMEEYTYEGTRQMLKVSYYWDKKTAAFVPSSKNETQLNPSRGGYEVTNYSYSNGEWSKNGSSKVEVDAVYDTTSPVAKIALEKKGPRANTVAVTFRTPAGSEHIKNWNVYRNGTLLGTANLSEGKYVYEDKEVLNGSYDYYVIADTAGTAGEQFISNVVSHEFNTPLDTVRNIRVVESGKKTIGSFGNFRDVYVYSLAWDAPKTDNTILGYNIYLNPSPYIKNPAPTNEKLITNTNYDLMMDSYDDVNNVIQIEIVYRIGFAKTGKHTITLDPKGNINKNRLTTVSKVVTFGDVMGGTGSIQPTKEEVRYYDVNNNLVMSVTNGYLYGDDPSTPQTEVEGQTIPTAYTVYDYDKQNRLIGERSRNYGVYSGYDHAWAKDFKQLATYAYDEATGKLIERCTETKKYCYEWEGENIVKEKVYVASTGNHQYTVTYSNFAASGKNLPQYGFSVSTNPAMQSFNRIYEYEYDKQGRKISERTYNFGSNIEKDSTGVIISADKGTPVDEKLWSYENDHLKSFVKNSWKTKSQAYEPNMKTEYSAVAGGVREESYSYINYGQHKGWIKESTYTETVDANVYGGTAPTRFALEDVEGKVNAIRLTCNAPKKTYGDSTVYEVFRNGTKVGVAKPDANGKLVYEEEEVENGTWHYFVKPSTPYSSIEVQSTNLIEKVFNTELPAVTNVTFPVNGVDENGDFKLVTNWEAPKSDLAIKGYNIFTDIKPYTKNPSPVNGVNVLPKETSSYEFHWSPTTRKDKTVCIEVVYNIGKVKSENFPVSLQNIPVGIISTEVSDQLTFVGNRILVNGNYQQLDVYAVNGAHMAQYAGAKTIDLTGLPTGVYVIQLKTAQGIKTMKVVKK